MEGLTLGEEEGESRPSTGPLSRWRRAVFVICLSLSLPSFSVYRLQPDSFAAVTVFPAWIWIPVPLVAGLVALGRTRTRGRLVLVSAWLLFAFFCVDETAGCLGLFRRLEQLERRDLNGFRVVVLNCAGGQAEAAAEVAAEKPQLVLLQESPSKAEVTRLAREIWGESGAAEWGMDGSILAMGRLERHELPPMLAMYFTAARWKPDPNHEVAVVSLRLTPAVFRFDLWNPECWRSQTENRRHRREQLQAVASYIESLPENLPVVVGGDFNAPARDAAMRVLQPRLRDAWLEGAAGWGDTIVNEYPLHRIDQVWLNSRLRAEVVFARKTVQSDHRMVVCDIVLR